MINFVLDTSQNYRLVQESLIASIAAHLDRARWTAAFNERRAGALNFALFVRQPADVVMSHGAADKNYFTGVLDTEGELYANRLRAILVPGGWLKRKLVAHPLLRLGESQIHSVGWPRLDILRQLARSRPPAARTGRTRVLWAPTHDFRKRGEEQRSTSSYPDFAIHLPVLEREFDVTVSVHPRNRQNKRLPTWRCSRPMP